MPIRAGSSIRERGTVAARRRVGAAAAGLAFVLAACSDSLPLAPGHPLPANVSLPPAAGYIVELGTTGTVSPDLATAIHDGGGRIVAVHPGTGLALVAGLSASAAQTLREHAGVALILPNRRRQLVPERALGTRLVLAGPATAAATDATHALSSDNPRTAEFFSYQWNMTHIRADSAWQITGLGYGSSVFILDTGIDTAQVDLVSRVDGARSTSFAYAPTDTLFENPLPYGHDVAGHGTFVSSIIATNGLGIAAVAPRAQLVMVRVLDDEGSGYDFAVLDGILWAADHGATVINLSLGGYLGRSDPFDLALADLYQRVIDYATQRGALVVAAAGNESVNFNTAADANGGSYADSLHVPAGGLVHVLSVGATGPVNQQSFDQIASYSNYGNAEVAVFAPGGNVVDSTQVRDLVLGACSSAFSPACAPENYYLAGAGTSFAAPHVAGEAAMIWAHATTKPSPKQLEQCILNSATEVNHVRPDLKYGFGRIDVLAGVLSAGCK